MARDKPFMDKPVGAPRYLMHYSDGGAKMVWPGSRLEEGGVFVAGERRYRVTRVEESRARFNGLGHAWCQPDE